MSCISPLPHIPSTVAQNCISLFTDHKKAVLTGIIAPKKVIDGIEYTAPVFLDLLTRLTDVTRNYDGFRIYFACHKTGVGSDQTPTGMDQQLTLVYVPTTANGTEHANDLTNCFIVFKSVVPKDLTDPANQFIRDWIRYYQEQRLPALETDGKLFDPKFEETKSLWYDIKNFGNPTSKDGLLSYIRCRIGDLDNPLISVVVKFAGFQLKDDKGNPLPFGYKLTVVFQLLPPELGIHGGSPYFSLSVGKKHHKKHEHNKPLDGDDDDDADTGNPCPPNSCDISLP